MLSFLDRTNFFSNSQFGFRSGRSTEHALLKVCSELYNSLNESDIPASLFIDITKAFDMVDHEILLSKLFNAGFRGFIHDWFTSYLKNRSQRVKINNILSAKNWINIGVPQGSVLGPILFLIFVNSLFLQPFDGKITAFADDTALCYSSKSYLNLYLSLNHDLELLRSWFKLHKLVISDKTKFMIFNFKGKVCEDMPLKYHSPNCKKFRITNTCSQCYNDVAFNSDICCSDNCFQIERVESFKYLGVTIDFKMSWANHTLILKQFLNKVIRQIYLLSQYCGLAVLKLVYNGLFKSKLQYGLVCWGGTSRYKIEPLLLKQKHAIRILCKVNRLTPSFELFKNLDLLPLRHLYFYKILRQFFEYSGYNSSRVYENRNLRVNARNLVHVPTIKKALFSHFYDITAPRIFNKLPCTLRCERVKSVFLKNIKNWLFLFDYDVLENILNPLI